MLDGIDAFEKIYNDTLTTDILKAMCDCDPSRLTPHTDQNPFVYDAQRMFMFKDYHVLVHVDSIDSIDRVGGNHRYTGYVLVDSDRWDFVVVLGNWVGIEIQEWYQE